MAKSRFDFVSVTIVAACILALIFLIYKTINLYNQKQAENTTTTEQMTEDEEADLYDKEKSYTFDEDGEIIVDEEEEDKKDKANNSGNKADKDSDKNTGGTTTKNTSSDGGNASNNTTDTKTADNGSSASNGSTTDTRPTSYTNSDGQYMVVAGSFRQKANANAHATKLRRLGYEDVEVSIFNRGAYATVLVDRFGDESEARLLSKELRKKGVDAMVITKQ